MLYLPTKICIVTSQYYYTSTKFKHDKHIRSDSPPLDNMQSIIIAYNPNNPLNPHFICILHSNPSQIHLSDQPYFFKPDFKDLNL